MNPETILIADLSSAVDRYREQAGIVHKLIEAAQASFKADDIELAARLLDRAGMVAGAMADAGGQPE